MRRYRCKACGTSFTALTGTALARLRHKLRHKECWLAFAETLSGGATVRGSADCCGLATTTAFRWRHRFLRAVQTGTAPLRAIVEAEETFILDSRKGDATSVDRLASVVARRPSAACHASRCRSWWPPTAAAPP